MCVRRLTGGGHVAMETRGQRGLFRDSGGGVVSRAAAYVTDDDAAKALATVFGFVKLAGPPRSSCGSW